MQDVSGGCTPDFITTMVIIAQNYYKFAISAKEQVKYIVSEFEINSIDNQTGKCWRWLFCFFGPGKVKLIKQGGKMVPFCLFVSEKNCNFAKIQYSSFV